MHSFRTANPDDLIQLNSLVNSAYRGESSKKGWTTEADLLDGQRTDCDQLFEMMSQPGASFELAIDSSDQQILGCVFLKIDVQTCYLGMLTVNPLLQAKGIGKDLLIHADAFARKNFCTQMRMTVIHSRQELINYYQRRGYELTGKTESFPVEDVRFGIPKQKIHFVEMLKSL